MNISNLNEKIDLSKISVIIPVYNAQAVIERCVESILAQDYSGELEIVLINDGSTDDSGNVCQKLALSNPDKIVCVTQPNGGVSSARNHGVKVASGDLICFVDADDILAKDMLSRLEGILRENNADVSECDFFTFDDVKTLHIAEGKSVLAEGKSVLAEEKSAVADDEKCAFGAKNHTSEETAGCTFKGINECNTKTVQNTAYIEHLIYGRDTHVWGKLYKKELFNQMCFPEDMTIGEDILFLLKLPENAKLAIADYKGYGYYVNPEGAMEKPFTPSYMDELYCWERVLGWMEDNTSKRLIYDELLDRTASYTLIAAMLVIAKLSKTDISRIDADKMSCYEETCKNSLASILKKYPAAKKELDYKYRIKIALYRCIPGLYKRLIRNF